MVEFEKSFHGQHPPSSSTELYHSTRKDIRILISLVSQWGSIPSSEILGKNLLILFLLVSIHFGYGGKGGIGHRIYGVNKQN
jgi:hypothetical protein